MTKRTFLTSFAVLALLATVSMVMAQPPGGGQRGQGGGPGGFQGGPQGGPQGGQPGGPPGGMMMGGTSLGVLMNPEARTALGITEEQTQKLQEAGRAMMQNMQPPQPPQPGQQPDMAAMRAQRQKMQEEGRKMLESVLSPDQVTKMDVMVFQSSGGLNPPTQNAGGPGGPPGGGRGGPGGMGINVESLRALNLTDDQKKKIQEAQNKMEDAMFAMRPQPGTNFQDMTQEERQAFFTKMQEAGQKASEEYRTTVNGVLTDAQKAKAVELMKDVPQFLQRPAPGPGGPGGPNRGNLNNFQPGGGVPGQNPNREQTPQRNPSGGPRFPG